MYICVDVSCRRGIISNAKWNNTNRFPHRSEETRQPITFYTWRNTIRSPSTSALSLVPSNIVPSKISMARGFSICR